MKRTIVLDELPSLAGQVLAVSEWLVVSQQMTDGFADLINDHQWIHVDIDRASRENGGTMAHGFLILSLLTTLSDSELDWSGCGRRLNYGFNRIRFANAVRCGARVRLRDKLVSAEEKGAGWLITRDCTLEIYAEEKPAVVAEWLTMAFPCSTSPTRRS
jgi:acyl dehydratase